MDKLISKAHTNVYFVRGLKADRNCLFSLKCKYVEESNSKVIYKDCKIISLQPYSHHHTHISKDLPSPTTLRRNRKCHQCKG